MGQFAGKRYPYAQKEPVMLVILAVSSIALVILVSVLLKCAKIIIDEHRKQGVHLEALANDTRNTRVSAGSPVAMGITPPRVTVAERRRIDLVDALDRAKSAGPIRSRAVPTDEEE